MSARCLSDDQVVDLLDQALREAKRRPTLNADEWSGEHPQLGAEGAGLLHTLLELQAAVEAWREPQDPPAPTDRGAGTVVLPEQRRQIGRYQVLVHVGSGAMGDVFKAYDPQLDRHVAIKVPRWERLEREPEIYNERFLREARAAAAVRHPHICPIFDAGEHDGHPYVVMAFVDGKPLDDLLRRGRMDDVRKSVRIAAEVAEALGEVHRHGIIHRDLKPGNILLDRSGQAILTDFGLALSTLNEERLTCDGILIGTPVYMSPEQAGGENGRLTAAADIYALGAVLYEMLTGQPPFRAPMQELLRKIMLEAPVAPTTHRPELDPHLAAIVVKILEKAPERRYLTADDLAAELRRWLAQAPLSPSAVMRRVPLNDTTEAPISAPQRKAGSWMRKVGAFVGSITLIVGLVWIVETGTGFGTANRSTANSSATLPMVNSPPDTPLIPPSLPPEKLTEADSPLPATAPRPLTGNVVIRISSDPEKGPVQKVRMAADERGALPLKTGELVHFEATLNQPAYAYLLWVSSDGSVTPIYPWDAEHHAGWDAPRVAGSESPIDRVMTPSRRTLGFEAVEAAGVQTVVLLARREPLDGSLDLEKLLAGLPSAPDVAVGLADAKPQLRGLKTGRTKSVEHPLFIELEQRLSPHFEFLRMVSFPQVD